MDANNYSLRYKEIIDKADLDENEKAIIKQNWLEFLTYLEERIKKNYANYFWLTAVSIVGGISIPAINSLPLENYHKYAISVLGIVTAGSVALNQGLQFNEKWRHFRLIVELARIEGETYFGRAGLYKDKSNKESFSIFIKRLSDIKNYEINSYFESLKDRNNKQDD